jgi:hypothetical protein
MSKDTSKFQAILDRIADANKTGDGPAVNAAIIEAFKMLAKGQQQVMEDLRNRDMYRTDIPIGKGTS